MAWSRRVHQTIVLGNERSGDGPTLGVGPRDPPEDEHHLLHRQMFL